MSLPLVLALIGATPAVDLVVRVHLDGVTRKPHLIVRNLGPGQVTKPFRVELRWPTLTTAFTTGPSQLAALNGPQRAFESHGGTVTTLVPGQVVEATVDAAQVIAEQDEGNNVHLFTWGVDECQPPADNLAPLPDLSIEAQPDPVLSIVHLTLRNEGGWYTQGSFRLKTSYGPSYGNVFGSSELWVTGAKLAALAPPGGEVTVALSIESNPFLTYAVFFSLDSACEVEESDKVDNTAVVVRLPSASPACAPWTKCSAALGICAPSFRTCIDPSTAIACSANGNTYRHALCPAGTSCAGAGVCVPGE
jgi:hypothetical protein